MSDETLHDSAPKATKALLGTVAFILIMVGIEQLVDRDGPRYFVGGSLIVGGIICSYAAVMWAAVREWLPDSAKQQVSRLALSPSWWLATLLVVVMAGALSPYVEDRRWPFLESRHATDEISEALRPLQQQFDAKTREAESVAAQLSAAKNELSGVRQQLGTLQQGARTAPEPQTEILWSARPMLRSMLRLPNGQMIAATDPTSIGMLDLRGTVQSSSAVQMKRAYIESGLTGEKKQFRLGMRAGYLDDETISVDEANPIAKDVQIMLLAEWNPALSISDFYRQWGRFTIHIEYNSAVYEKKLDESDVKNIIVQDIPNADRILGAPRITKKSDSHQ